MNARHLLRTTAIRSLTAAGMDGLARSRMKGLPAVRIILAHGTPRSSRDAFRRQLEWVSRRFDLIDFERFKRLLAEPESRPDRPAAMYTFDDGLRSNHEFGAPILEEFGTRGVFFAVPGFCLAPDSAAAKAYFQQHLRGGDSPDFDPMSPAQLRDLAERGHTIGSHTYSHTRLSETPGSMLGREIGESADVLGEWIGRPVETFAWTFYWSAITREAHQAARARHPYCFAPCPGPVVAGRVSPSLIWRTNVEAWADPATIRFAVSGLVDPIWASRRRRLEAMLGASAG